MTPKKLLKKRVPHVLIPGLLLAIALGFKADIFKKVSDYYQIKQIFPNSGVVQQVEDGDTFTLRSGVKVRLIGISSPDRGKKNYIEAKEKLERLVSNKKVYLEYDRYQDDKYGRILAWVWVDCETTPRFLPPDYMHKSDKESNPGILENPKGCKKGKLVNEELIKSGLGEMVSYRNRGPLKYEARITSQ